MIDFTLITWCISCHQSDDLFDFIWKTLSRRQTAEEREAERQAANRLMLSIQAEAMTKTLYPPTVTSGSTQRSSSSMQQHETTPTQVQHRPINSPSTSLNALQSLQPWAESTSEPATSPSSGYHHWKKPFLFFFKSSNFNSVFFFVAYLRQLDYISFEYFQWRKIRQQRKRDFCFNVSRFTSHSLSRFVYKCQ